MDGESGESGEMGDTGATAVTGTKDDAFATWGRGYDEAVGSAVIGVGDVDGDGLDDVAIGGRDKFSDPNGRVWLYVGPFSGHPGSADADLTLWSATAGDYLGIEARSLAGVRDADGDGLADLLVGAYLDTTEATHGGAAWIVAGTLRGIEDATSAAMAMVFGETEEARVGAHVVAAGDVDGDGTDDVWIGAYGNDENGALSGSAPRFHGPMAGAWLIADADARFHGPQPSACLGPVGPAGDVDGDGLADLIARTSGATGSESASGMAWVIFGKGI